MKPVSSEFRACIAGGWAATAVVTVLMYAAPAFDLPFMDMASAIGGFDSRPALVFSSAWWVGLAIFLITGILLSPTIYFWMRTFLFGNGWQKGVQWGVLLWVFGGVCVMTHFGFAFHEPYTGHPMTTSLLSFMAHIVYGAVLGSVTELALRVATAAKLRHRAV